MHHRSSDSAFLYISTNLLLGFSRAVRLYWIMPDFVNRVQMLIMPQLYAFNYIGEPMWQSKCGILCVWKKIHVKNNNFSMA